MAGRYDKLQRVIKEVADRCRGCPEFRGTSVAAR